MTRTHRRWHFVLWMILTPIVAALLILSLMGTTR